MNYINSFVTVADDCPLKAGSIPPAGKARKSVALILFEILTGHPYEYTQEDVLFMTYLKHNDLRPVDEAELRREFLSKPMACLRSSPLSKKYGWGFHFDAGGKVALYGVQTAEYRRLSASKDLKVMKALRSKKPSSD